MVSLFDCVAQPADPVLSFIAETVLLSARFPLEFSALESYVELRWSWLAGRALCGLVVIG